MKNTNAYKTLFAVILVTLFGVAGIALPFPILAPLFLESGVTPLTTFLNIEPKLLLSFVLATYPLGLLIGSSFLGAVSDSYGRKPILLFTLVVACVGYGFSALAIIQQNYVLLLVSRFATGVCEGNIAIARAIGADLHPAIDKTRSMSWIYTASSAGWLLGPAIGGFLMPYGAELVFYVAGGSLLLATVVVYFYIEQDAPSAKPTESVWQLAVKQNSIKLLKDKQLAVFTLIYFLTTLGLNGFYEFYPVWLVENLRFDSRDIALITVALTFTMMLSSAFVVEKLKNRFGKAWSLCLALSFMTLLLVIMPNLGLNASYVTYAAMGIFIGIAQNMFPVFASDRYEYLGNGRVLGLLTTVFCFSSVLMALFGGFIILLSTDYIFWFSAMLVFAALIGFYLFDKHTEFNPRASKAQQQ